jgi:hypothetical protein
VATTIGTSYNPPGTLDNITSYSWRIDSVNAFTTTTGTVWSFTTVASGSTPVKVTTSSPVDNATGVITAPTLSWSAASGADSYAVYFGTTLPETPVATTTGTSYSPPGTLAANTHYYYRVCAHNDSSINNGNSGYAMADTLTRLPAPSALTATYISSSQIALTWTNVTSATGGYKIYRGSISDGPYTTISTTDTNAVTYNDNTAVTGSHTYYYRVRATNTVGDGDESPEANATTAGNWSTALSVPIVSNNFFGFIGCKTNGTLWKWSGSGAPFQVVTGTTNWSTVAAGADFSPYFFARQTNGTLWSWGDNYMGQLGLDDTNDRNTPTLVGSDWSQVACGQMLTIAIKTNGTIWSCGFNFFGQLGRSGAAYDPNPTFMSIGADSDWSMVAAGGAHSIARKTNGTIWTWGCPDQGQLGLGQNTDGNNVSAVIPTPVGTTSDWSLITAGGYHTAAIKTNGSLWVWGENDSGQLGLGYTSGDYLGRPGVGTPTQESTSASDWSAVACGEQHTIALKTNGSLWAWGSGYGMNPSRIGSDTDWSIIKGGILSIARKTNGTVWKITGMTTTLVGE